jgi:hypothetical protein
MQGLYADTINEADEYLYPVGRIRLFESALLSRQHLERAGETKKVEQAWEILGDSSRWWSAREIVDPGDWEIHLEARLAGALKEVAFMTPVAPIAKAFSIRWDFLSLKEKERRAAFGEGGDADWAEKIAQEGGFVLQKEIPLDYREALTRLSELLAREPVPQTVDRVLDAEMFRIVFRWLLERPVPFARQYFSRRVDLLNFSVALRGKRPLGERSPLLPALSTGRSWATLQKRPCATWTKETLDVGWNG